ncbi:MAG TPA: YkgJ family cysteine cluster protein [Thermoanaerobaculia bacterium]|nr:YkgJ family cysteine cluster protein [Thermoanaerobaculia bacterium]
MRSDRRLLQVVDQALTEAARLAARGEGSWLACRPGCTECCHGPFPINRLDVHRLRAGLAELAEREPERARAIAERARAQLSLLRRDFPGDARSGVLTDGDDDAAEAFFSRVAALSCPVLDPDTGRCELYAHRPLTCRTFGPPVKIGESALPPCRLCFQGAAAEVIEACRVEPDPHGLEDRILDRLGEEETLIAFALASPNS